MMDIITVEMPMVVYQSLPLNIRDEMTAKNIEPKDYDYSNDEIWIKLNAIAAKAYKAKKEREFNIRHNLIQ